VHYLKFPLSTKMVEKLLATAELGSQPSGSPLVKLIVRHPRLELARALPPEVVRAIAGDLLDGSPAT
jgi:hypothetical protein